MVLTTAQEVFIEEHYRHWTAGGPSTHTASCFQESFPKDPSSSVDLLMKHFEDVGSASAIQITHLYMYCLYK